MKNLGSSILYTYVKNNTPGVGGGGWGVGGSNSLHDPRDVYFQLAQRLVSHWKACKMNHIII